jgi:hypothetical protein
LPQVGDQEPENGHARSSRRQQADHVEEITLRLDRESAAVLRDHLSMLGEHFVAGSPRLAARSPLRPPGVSTASA